MTIGTYHTISHSPLPVSEIVASTLLNSSIDTFLQRFAVTLLATFFWSWSGRITVVIWWLVQRLVGAVLVVWRWLDRGNPRTRCGWVRTTLARKLKAVWKKARVLWERGILPRVAHRVASWKKSFGPIFARVLRWVEDEADDMRERARRARTNVELWWI